MCDQVVCEDAQAEAEAEAEADLSGGGSGGGGRYRSINKNPTQFCGEKSKFNGKIHCLEGFNNDLPARKPRMPLDVFSKRVVDTAEPVLEHLGTRWLCSSL